MIERTREFIHLASTLSFAQAARDLNTSQPSLRRHISELEALLGFKLFDRNPLVLTTAGCHYLEAMSSIMGEIDSTVNRCRQIARGGKESLVISSIPFELGPYSKIVYKSIAQMRSENASFTPTFFYSSTLTIPQTIFTGKADIGVVFSQITDVPTEFTCEPIMEYPGMIWAHKDNPGLHAPIVRASNFSNSLLVESTNKMYASWLEGEAETLADVGLQPKTCLREIENSADFFIMMRRSEIKITMDLGSTVCPYNPDVIGVVPVDPPLRIKTYLLYRNKPIKPQVSQFVENCRKVARELMENVGNLSPE